MSDYLHPNGYTYSIEEVEMAAISAGVDYDEFVKSKGFTPTDKTRTQLKLYNKKINYTADPNASYKNKYSGIQIDAETMKLTEGKAKDKLMAIAPDGTEQMFDFDNMFGAQGEADKLNEFIKNTINTTDINIDSYSQAWDYLSKRKNTYSKGRKHDDLSSEELQCLIHQHRQ